jgi:hypothetical protein
MTDEFAPVEITSMARMLSIRQHATFALLRQDLINWLRGYPKAFLFFRRIFRFFKRTLRRIKGT